MASNNHQKVQMSHFPKYKVTLVNFYRILFWKVHSYSKEIADSHILKPKDSCFIPQFYFFKLSSAVPGLHSCKGFSLAAVCGYYTLAEVHQLLIALLVAEHGL